MSVVAPTGSVRFPDAETDGDVRCLASCGWPGEALGRMPMAMREETAVSEVAARSRLWGCQGGCWLDCQSVLMRGSLLDRPGSVGDRGAPTVRTTGAAVVVDLSFPAASAVFAESRGSWRTEEQDGCGEPDQA